MFEIKKKPKANQESVNSIAQSKPVDDSFNFDVDVDIDRDPITKEPTINTVIKQIIDRDTNGLMASVEAFNLENQQEYAYINRLNEIAKTFHQITMLQNMPNLVYNKSDKAQISLWTATLSKDRVIQYYKIAIQGKTEIGNAPDPSIGFMMVLMQMVNYQPAVVEKVAATQSEVTDIHSEKNVSAEAESKLFNGNWKSLVDQLKLGIVRQLALNLQIENYHYDDTNKLHFHFYLNPEYKHLLLDYYKDKIQSELSNYYKTEVVLKFEIKQSVALAVRNELTDVREQLEAEESIRNDPFVNDLINLFDATIVPNTVKPNKIKF